MLDNLHDKTTTQLIHELEDRALSELELLLLDRLRSAMDEVNALDKELDIRARGLEEH